MKLEKFQNKSFQQKAIKISSILLVLLITIVVVYRSFAFFENSQEFNVIKGQVPEQNYDLMLSYTIEDEYGNKSVSDTAPNERNYKVNVSCNNGATGYWDYDKWNIVISNVLKSRTKCQLSFQPTNSFSIFTSLLNVNSSNIESFLQNDIDSLVENEDAMTYLSLSNNLIDEMKNSSYYTDEVKQKILNSKVISEEMKYRSGLPCYLVSSGSSLTNVIGEMTLIGAIAPTGDSRYNVISLFNNGQYYVLASNLSGASGTVSSSKKIDISNYNVMSLNFGHFHNCTGSSGTTTLAISSSLNSYMTDVVTSNSFVFQNYSSNTQGKNDAISNFNLDISNFNGEYYIFIRLNNAANSCATVYNQIHTISLY